MGRPKVDNVDRIIDAFTAATPEQWKEAMRTICRLQAARESGKAAQGATSGIDAWISESGAPKSKRAKMTPSRPLDAATEAVQA